MPSEYLVDIGESLHRGSLALVQGEIGLGRDMLEFEHGLGESNNSRHKPFAAYAASAAYMSPTESAATPFSVGSDTPIKTSIAIQSGGCEDVIKTDSYSFDDT